MAASCQLSICKIPTLGNAAVRGCAKSTSDPTSVQPLLSKSWLGHRAACPLEYSHQSRGLLRSRSLVARKKREATSISVASPAELISEEQGNETSDNQGSTFSWLDHWYPVALLEDLDPELPTPFQLLGKEIVLWRDATGTWQAFLDFCPHRLAPLSEGRIDENGWLQCSYHGWSFKADGSCAVIPQASKDGPEAKAVFSPRACAVRLPTTCHQGLLFVWPDEKTVERSASVPIPSLPPQFEDPSFSTVSIQRDLFYSFDTLMENVSDPSHIDFAHHKVTGRRERAKPMPFKVAEAGPWGFKGRGEEGPREGADIIVDFQAPCFYVNTVNIPRGEGKTWTIVIASYNIPMAPGKTRSIVLSARNFFRFLMPGPNWWNIMPRWLEHTTSNKVYDGDMIVLQGQEKILRQLAAAAATPESLPSAEGNGHSQVLGGASSSPSSSTSTDSYTRLTFTPTGADRFVLAFRGWLRKWGGGQPQWMNGVVSSSSNSTATTDLTPITAALSKREMLDRLGQHTEKCASCRSALSAIHVGQKALKALVILLLAAAVVLPDLLVRGALAGSALTLYAILINVVNKWEEQLTFVDYVHAKIK